MSKLPTRGVTKKIIQDLKQKMVFLGGPRQVGKTTLAQSLITEFHDQHPAYLNWDNQIQKQAILSQSWPPSEPLIVLDEVHKYRDWQNLVKGFYDSLKNTHQFLVTGSAHLNHFRRGGDSLLGRYFYYRLHPYSVGELGADFLKPLFTFGGFPEPLAAQEEKTLRRWHLNRVHSLVRQDLRDLEQVSDIDKVEKLALALVSRVGSPLSIQSLTEDLLVSHKTVARWLDILETLYYSFRIPPYGQETIRAVKKEQKLYLWDWSQIEEVGARWENMIASQLLKYCHHQEDTQGCRMELRYIRDTNAREVDFVVLQDQKPQFGVEAKYRDTNLDKSIAYFSKKLKVPRWYQVVYEGKSRSLSDSISVITLPELCEAEGLS